MADNYLGNLMDDYRAGRLKRSAPRRLTPSGAKPGALPLAVDAGERIWIAAGAMLPAGLRLIELLVNSGLKVSYRGLPSETEPAIRLGARHYPPTVAEPQSGAAVTLTEDTITIDSGRAVITYPAGAEEQAATMAAALLSSAGRKVASARISF